jgi:hypothetical protein
MTAEQVLPHPVLFAVPPMPHDFMASYVTSACGPPWPDRAHLPVPVVLAANTLHACWIDHYGRVVIRPAGVG